MRLRWTADEVILAAALAQENGWKGLRASDPEVRDLSELLRQVSVHPESDRDPDFRNPNSVARKTWDVATIHPTYEGRPTRGGKTDAVVVRRFVADPDGMAASAAALRRSLERGLLGEADMAAVDELEAPEGRLLYAMHRRRERDPRLRQHKIDQVTQAGGALCCEACGFDFGATYGDRGRGYIEVHHVRPLHDSGPTRTRLADLALLCANCHRMIHRTRPWLTPCGLREVIADAVRMAALP
jgi:5-methylcytosine-specific restriction enzyme A